MLKHLRIAAGLGEPPQPYKVIRQQVKYKAQELPRFVMLMKEMIVSIKKAIEKAVINMGEYIV